MFSDLVRLAVSFGMVPSSISEEESGDKKTENSNADTQDVNVWNADNAGNAYPPFSAENGMNGARAEEIDVEEAGFHADAHGAYEEEL